MFVLAWAASVPLALAQILAEIPCENVTHGWCQSTVICESSSGETSRFSRIRSTENMGPIDTGNIHYVNEICQNHSLNLPSVHSDIDNWCLYHAGLHGTKGRVPLGLFVNPNGTWAWADGSRADYDRFHAHPEQKCARIDGTLYWTAWPCDTSEKHDQLDYVVCSAVPETTTTDVPLTNVTSVAPPSAPPKSSVMTETKEANTHLYWAIPTVVLAVVAAFVAWWKRSHSKEETPMGIGIQLFDETARIDPPQVQTYVYGNNSDSVSIGSTDSDGYLKPEPVYSVIQPGQYDMAENGNENDDNVVPDDQDYDLAMDQPLLENGEQSYDMAQNVESEAVPNNKTYDMAQNVEGEAVPNNKTYDMAQNVKDETSPDTVTYDLANDNNSDSEGTLAGSDDDFRI